VLKDVFPRFDYTPNLFFSFTMQDYQQSYLHCPISLQQENLIPFYFICPGSLEVLKKFGYKFRLQQVAFSPISCTYGIRKLQDN
jgi:hypothetical protein